VLLTSPDKGKQWETTWYCYQFGAPPNPKQSTFWS